MLRWIRTHSHSCIQSDDSHGACNDVFNLPKAVSALDNLQFLSLLSCLAPPQLTRSLSQRAQCTDSGPVGNCLCYQQTTTNNNNKQLPIAATQVNKSRRISISLGRKSNGESSFAAARSALSALSLSLSLSGRSQLKCDLHMTDADAGLRARGAGP